MNRIETKVRLLVVLIFTVILASFPALSTTIFPPSWTCTQPVTDVFSCLECASQMYDNCTTWCRINHQDEPGTYCMTDCRSEYWGGRSDCQTNFGPLWN